MRPPIRMRHLPPRLVTGAFILNSGLDKLRADKDTAQGLHGSASAAYPFLGALDADTFARLLAASETTLGIALLVPIIPTGAAGLGLAGFSAGLVGLYLRTPGARREGSLRPTPEGLALAKDTWMLGIGLSFVIDALTSRADRDA
ncbi:MAG: hypothetical protein ACRDQA_11760 [Nocardioidaceae bacterium]